MNRGVFSAVFAETIELQLLVFLPNWATKENLERNSSSKRQ
jgi:hypothetical protein